MSNPRKVIRACLHDLKLNIGGVQMPTKFPSESKTIPDLAMWYDGSVLEITALGKTFGVPLANVQYFEFEPASKTALTQSNATSQVRRTS